MAHVIGTLRFAKARCYYGYEKSKSLSVKSAHALQYGFSAVACFSTTAKYFVWRSFHYVSIHFHFLAIFMLISPFSELRGCPCKNRPLDFRPKTEFLQIFRVRQLVHVINKNGNNLAFNAIFQYFWRQFQRTV